MRTCNQWAWLTVEASLKIESSIFPLKVCERIDCNVSSSHSAALCTVITTDCMWEVYLITEAHPELHHASIASYKVRSIDTAPLLSTTFI